jgi:hypothetical protein
MTESSVIIFTRPLLSYFALTEISQFRVLLAVSKSLLGVKRIHNLETAGEPKER